MAGECKAGCYAQQGAYAWSNVAQAFKARHEATLRDDFVEMMSAEIGVKHRTAQRTGDRLMIRIHDSGDFYSPEYLMKWVNVVSKFPDVHFYAYTKSVSMIRRTRDRMLAGYWPSNFRIIFSEGGLEDHKIGPDDRHARVFSSREELEAAGYVDCTDDDWLAATTGSYLIGLVYHGAKSKQWRTGA